jgi:hypothetical protein
MAACMGYSWNIQEYSYNNADKILAITTAI